MHRRHLLLLVAALALASRPLILAQAPHEAKAEADHPQAKERTDQYGDPLPRGALARLGTVRFRHGYPIWSLAFSPDGTTLLSNVAKRMGQPIVNHFLWDTTTGKERRRFSVEGAMLNPIHFTRTGRIVLLDGSDSDIAFYDVMSGQRKPFRAKLPAASWSIALSGDAKTVAALTRDGFICVGDPDSPRQVPLFVGPVTGQKDNVVIYGCVLVLSDDGKKLAFTHYKQEKTGLSEVVRVWDVARRQELRGLAGLPSWHSSHAFLPDGRMLSVGRFGDVVVLDPTTGKQSLRLKFPHRDLGPGHLSPDARLLAIRDRSDIVLVEMATGKTLRRFAIRGRPCCAFSPDGKVLAVGGDDGTIRFWEVATGREVRPSPGHHGAVETVTTSPDGKTVATVGADQTIRHWEAASGKELARIAIPRQAGQSDPEKFRPCVLAFDVAGRRLVAARPDGDVSLWEPVAKETLRNSACLEGHRPGALSSDGRLVLSTCPSGAVGLWKAASGESVRLFAPRGVGKVDPKGDNSATALALSPDGRLAAAGWGGQVEGPVGTNYIPHVQIWDTASGRERKIVWFNRFQGGMPAGLSFASSVWDPVGLLRFSPDGRTLAIGIGGVIHLWDMAGDREARRVDAGDPPAGWAVAFSPDGRVLALGQRDGFFLSDVATGRELCRASGHEGPVTSLAFSPDGRRLITGGADSTGLVWDVPFLLAEARRKRVTPSKAELEVLWRDMGSEDGARADRAVWALVAAPGRAVPLLRDRLQPVPPADSERIARLVTELSSERFAARDLATRELESLGELASPALDKALKAGGSLELRRRAEQLVQKANRPVSDPAKMRALLAVEALERIGTQEAKQILQRLAGGAAGARLTRDAQAALTRLARLESLPALSP
jgi:WD40 repeat protein